MSRPARRHAAPRQHEQIELEGIEHLSDRTRAALGLPPSGQRAPRRGGSRAPQYGRR